MELCLPAFSNAELTESLARHLLDDRSSHGCHAVAMEALEMEAQMEDRSSVLQDRDFAAAEASPESSTGQAPGDSPRRPRTAPRLQTRPPPSPCRRRRQPPPGAFAATTRPLTASATASGLYGSAQVPDIRISRDPVAAYRESLQVSMRAFRRRQWRPLDVEALARDPEDIDRRSCSVAATISSRPMSAVGSSTRFPAPRRRPKSVPAEALNSRTEAAAAREGTRCAADAAGESGTEAPPPAAGAEADETREAAPEADPDDGANGDWPQQQGKTPELRSLRLEDCAPAFTPRFYQWQGSAEAVDEESTAMAAAASERRRSGDGCSSDGDSGSEGDSNSESESDSGSDSDDDNRSPDSHATETPAEVKESVESSGAPGERRQRRGRQLELNLRPERDPQFLLPSSSLEPDKIEFSARLVRDLPRFEFGSALPEPFDKASFRSMAECTNGWRSVFPEQLAPEPALVGLMDRLVAMERMQLDTMRTEGSRVSLLRRAVSTVSTSAAVPSGSAPDQRPARIVSGHRPRSRNCCRGCLQVACAGDCPLKRAPPRVCLHCRQPLCTDRACLRRTYDERARGETEKQPPRQAALLPPKVCKPCGSRQQQQQQQQQMALLSKQLPRSQLPTYSSSVQSRQHGESKRRQVGRLPAAVNFSEQLRDATGSAPADVTKEQNSFRPYVNGRNALLPGKTRTSMRRNSLTTRRATSANP